MLGRRSIHTALGGPTTAAGLLAEMDRVGIDEALVYHGMAVDGFPPEGNERLLREIAGQPRLHPCWVLLPSTGELPPPKDLVAQMQARGVRAARMNPLRHRYLFTQANVGDLLAALAMARIPLWIDFEMTHWAEEKTDWRSLADLCERHPELPLVVVGEGMAAPRRLFPIWERHPNLHLETTYYQVHQGLSEIAARFGADRLLFGSGLPVRAAGAPLTQLRHDFLSDTDRAAIGGGNLRNLLAQAHGGAVQTAHAPHIQTGGASITDLPPHPILDMHVHLGRWFSTYINQGEADGLVRSMDRLGIRSMALIAFDSIAADMRGGNDRVAAAMRAHPGRFLGYATVDPNETGAMTRELERCFNQLNFHAIKFHCDTHGCLADSPNYRPALEFADAHGLCILIHGVITAKMLEAYPQAQFISAHVGAWDGRSPHYAVELSKRFPNIHLDLAASAIYHGALEKLVVEAGADRIIHGSDAPLMDPAYQLGRVLGAKLSAADRKKILYDNAARIFRLKPQMSRPDHP